MTVNQLVQSRGITELLHFTTNKGILGILDSHSVKARSHLDLDERLKAIFTPNAASRTRDSAYLNYVNLSISRINNNFFRQSARNWHKDKDLWWCVISISPEILSHPGVIFTTTNNIYTGVHREQGGKGLEALFAPKIVQWSGQVVKRGAEERDDFTTCSQAEVLYPEEVDTKYLQKIYVLDGEAQDQLEGQFAGVSHPAVPIQISSNLFEK